MDRARCICRIDLAQLERNFRFIQSCAPSCRVMPVLKYNAYGMGVHAVGAALKAAGAYRFAAATLDEALELAPQGLDVQILGILPPWEIAAAVAADIICPAESLETAALISAEAVRQNKTVRLAVKIDTGMGRVGIPAHCAVETVKAIAQLPALSFDSLYAHFAAASQPDTEFCLLQIERFKQVKSALDAEGIFFKHCHHAAGDASVKIPQAVQEPFNLIRPGGRLYGVNFTDSCKQVVELKAHVGAVRSIPAGESVGYNRMFIAGKTVRTAVITAGYADGVPLALTNKGRVLIRGKSCPVIGRVSMDYTVVDVTHLETVSAGDEAVLLGRQGDNAVTVEEWGLNKNTHGHDIWCAIGNRVKREYIW